MEAILEKINLKNLDKSNWELYRFEEITKRVSETVDPNTTELEVYVGLEHIDPQDIHIRRFGTPKDVSGGKLKCYPGDVIFGKRRAYQRKAAVVDFEGICSAHAFVFRANANVIDAKLFPFFLHSDQFMHRMVDISVGGLSPTINWSDLKHQEFLLPPKAEQGRLAELLWAMDEVIEKEKKVLEKLERNKNSCIVEFLKNTQDSKKISDLGQVITGNTPSTSNSNYWGSSIPFVTPGDINDCTFVQDTERYLTLEGANKSRLIPRASVLVVCIGSTIGKVAINKFDCCSNQQINSIVPHAGVSSTYLFCSLKLLKKRILAKSGTTAVPIVNKTEFESIMIPFIDKTSMIQLENTFNYFESAIDGIKAKISASQALQKTLINQIF